MAISVSTLEKCSLDRPSETRSMPKARIEVVKLGEQTCMRATFEPGWRWSEHVKPTVGTDLCEVQHVGYLIKGQLATRMRDGRELVVQPGEFVTIPPGHDGWVVGEDNAVFIDFVGGADYGKPASR